MNETDFEKRLRGHLAAKARLIEVPDHKFVQTKVVPFQPRRSRLNNLVMAAAGVAVVAMLGFGLAQTDGLTDDAGVIPTRFERCEIVVVPSSELFWVQAETTDQSVGPFGTGPGQTIKLAGGLPLIVKVFDAPDATEPVVETTITTADGACAFGVSVSNGPTGYQIDVAQR